MEFHNQLKSLALLIFMLSTCQGTSLAKQHPVRHAHSRHKRQYGHPSDFVPDSYILHGSEDSEYGNWSPWSAPSECSRTCGGGVAFQTRYCLDASPDGQPYCRGSTKRYFSCNIQECQNYSDFRSEQCAEYNRVPFEDRYYDWVPYTKAPNPCELNCMPRGERFYYRHNKKVIDGTLCDDEKLNVCVDGRCLPVGCDRLLGSPAREDNCRECGGDGSSCNTVEGLLDNNDLQVGYNDILLIPAGATNIRVNEIQPTNNYLAVRNTTGHYYLNGNWRIDFPRKLRFAGTVFHYERKPHGFYAPEMISALGPTTEPIYISLLYQEPNPGIRYEYSIPKGILVHSLSDNYTWVESEFGPCSMTCGGGTQQRSVICVRRRDMVQMPENLCNANYMPTSIQSCSPEPCPPSWNAGPWSQCSESCEKGIQERQVYCMQIVANGLPSVADESECNKTGEKPPNKQECNIDVTCPTWHIGPWKRCDKLCGEGKETRDVICYRKTEERIEVLDDAYCPEEKPEFEKPCLLRPCEGVDWITSDWSGCDEKCGLTQETRTAYCVTQTGVVYPDSFCHKYRKPKLVRNCETSKKCEHEWYATQWSECSSKCSSGIQTRKVFCGEIDDAGFIKKVEDSKCNPVDKYDDEKECVGAEECKGDWFSGPWSGCSKDCGGGQKTRKVLCIQDNDTVPISNCDGNSIPFSSESCNNHPCGEDEVYTVEPMHDLSEDEEDCEYDEDFEIEIEDEEEDVTTPLDSSSEANGTSDLTTEISLSSILSNDSSDLDSLLKTYDFTSESDMFPLSTSFSSFESSTTDFTTPDVASESSLSSDASSEISMSSSLGTVSTLSSMSSSSSSLSSSITGDGSKSISTDGTGSSISESSTENSSSSNNLSSSVGSSSSDDSTTFSSSGSTEANESSSETEFTSSSSPKVFSDEISTDSSSISDKISSSFSENTSQFSTESTEFSSFEATESSSELSESTFKASTLDITDSSDSTIFSEIEESSSLSSTELLDSSSWFSTDSTKQSKSSLSVSTETQSSTSASTEDTESTESSSAFSTDSTKWTDSSSSISTEGTEFTDSSSPVSTDSTESTESSPLVSTDSTESTESSPLVSTDSTESTESSPSVSTDSTESTDSTPSVSTDSTESTESTPSVSTDSTESTESTPSVSTDSTESTESTPSVSTDSTESTESSSSVSTETQSYTSGSTENTESTESSSSFSTHSTKWTESSSSISTDSTEFTQSSSPVSTESTESTESSSSVSTESTQFTESSSSSSPESTQFTESSSSSTTESTEFTESSSPVSTDSTESTESSSSVSTESTQFTESSSSIITLSTIYWSSSVSTESTAFTDTINTGSSTLSSIDKIFLSSTVNTDITAATESTSETSVYITSTNTDVSTESESTKSREFSESSSTETEITSSKTAKDVTSFMSTDFTNTQTSEGTEYSSSDSEFTESMKSSALTFTGISESIESTASALTESTESFTSESTEITETNDFTSQFFTKDTEITDYSSEVLNESAGFSTDVSSMEDLWGPSMSSIRMAITKEQKLKKCKPKKKPKCRKSEFGCCPDNKTAAEGPFGKGCPQHRTCQETEFGCCPDGVSPVKGENEKGCPPFDCKATLFGCCPDKVTPSQGNDFEGCPEEILPAECSASQFGCCPDNTTSATGPNFMGCYECEGSGDCDTCNATVYGCCADNIRAATGPNFQGCEDGSGEIMDCANSTYGCCPDGIISAEGPNFENCGVIDSDNCTLSHFGCCPDGVTPALGSRYEGCNMPCESEPYGCCDDNITPAHGPNREGCCLNSQFGCCPDNILYARGPNFEGCGCQYSPYQCCPDNQTAARGHNNEGCGCQYTTHGCCPDNYTPAPGPGYQGCPCYTFQFGCCPDGISVAKGPQRLGCGCQNTEFGCCSDGQTPATGPEKAGCGCEASEFGCCPDGVEEALGEDFNGCKKQLQAPGEICMLPKDRGPCREFTVKWFYDMQYGGCTRFWYGGCEGNDNKFRSQEECNAVCVTPENKDRCYLPKVEGPCEKYYPKWYYDKERKQCGQFIYGGCLGNTNNFDTREECQKICAPEPPADPCEHPVDEGPCEGNFTRWHYDQERKTCLQFRYGGCKANGNNFLTESACKEQCLQPGRTQVVSEICRLERDPGPCRGSVRRWYYDRQVGHCRQFFYGGCLGNNNRFKTEAECIQKCQINDSVRDHCSLPREPGNCDEKIPRWYFDNSENRCMPFYYTGCMGNANRFETREECETDCPPRVYKDICHLPALIGECYNYTERWYYDVQARRCSPFYYGGCGGNQNNFERQIDCQKRCETYVAEERVDIATPKPVTPEPEHFKVEYCFYGSDPGSCRPNEFFPKWFYDRADGVCKQFLYGGCDGNGNRFDSREECEHYCGHAQDICILPKIVGPCNGNQVQWYYERNTDSCYEFDYGGCQGNGNRFNTRYDCEVRCKQGPVEPPTVPPALTSPTTLVPIQPPSYETTEICYMRVDPGPCLGEYSSWYYDPYSQRCQTFVYGGCLGNANKFDSEEQCERQCGRFRSQDVCNLPLDIGQCGGKIQKWFYDATNKVCREFTYSGCNGNGNRFSTVQECETICFHREEVLPVSNDTTLPHYEICRLPMEVGPCNEVQYKRWYYEESQKTCVPFLYSGCGGNFNRFKNFDTCVKFCVNQMRDISLPSLVHDPNEIVVHVPEYCQEERRKCNQMHCPYGIEKFVDAEDCERCRCNNPCREHYCPEGTRCGVDLYHDESGRIEARGVCREEIKPGQCPILTSGSGSCTVECQSDADCPGVQKCCASDCLNIPMTSCMHPIQQMAALPPVFHASTSPPLHHTPFYGAQPPTIIAGEMHLVEPEGSYATLKCSVRGIPTPVVSWRKDNALIDGSGGRHKFLVDGSLQIVGLHSSDAGVYHCAANNGVGHPVQKEFTLEITDPTPRPAEVIGDENTYVVVTLGTPVILQCYAIGWPRPGVTWWRGDRMLPLSSGQYEQRRDFSLLVKTVSLKNLGPYVCQAYNGLGKASSGTVTVQATGPVYTTNPEDGPYLQYLVNVPQIPESPYLPSLTHSSPVETTKVYEPPRTSSSTPHTTPTPQPTPRVFVVPLAVNISLDQKNFAVGSDISIPCNVDGYPLPRVTWYKDDEEVHPSKKVEITESNRLRIIRADGSDSGLYRCVAHNQYEEVSSQIHINVEGVYIHPNCTDNIFFANCELIVKARHCQHKYYARFCCRSCTKAGQLPSHGPHLDDMKQTTQQ